MTETFPRARDPRVFPPTVALHSVTIPADAAETPLSGGIALPPALARATAKRRVQFVAGRFCARSAIAALAPGVSVGALPQDADGCPVWPSGLIGSIAHSDAFAVAAVARLSEAAALGVDVEPVMTAEVAAELAGLVAGPEEAGRAAEAAGFSEAEALTLVFSAKECLYKALYPPTRKRFDYRDCELARINPDGRRFAIRFRPPFDRAFGATEFEGRYELADGSVRTGAIASPDLIRRAL